MLDEVIALIRASEDTDTARTGLMGLLDIDQVQADAILAMQLRTLTRMNRDKIVAEHEELQRKIADYIDILANRNASARSSATSSTRSSPSTATTAAPRSCRSPAR